MTLIEAFEVPPEEDEAFLAGLGRPRDGSATPGRGGGTALHRALREDAALRWVAVTRLDGPEPALDRPGPAAPGAGAWRVHTGAYEVVHDEGAVDGDGGVVGITAFEAREADEERFRAWWETARAAEAGQRGCLGIRLHRGVGPARLRWVQIARWSSPLMVHRARQRPEVRGAAEGLPFPAHAALYQVVGP